MTPDSIRKAMCAGYSFLDSEIDEAFQILVAAERERCAKVAEGWATSKTCNADGTPCEHKRTGGGIADAIRKVTP